MEHPRTVHLAASPPLFKNSLLDRFTRVHPYVPLVLFLPVIALALIAYVSDRGLALAQMVGLFLVGVLVWSLLEYWLHRVVFHFRPRAGWQQWVAFLMHGVHHEHPNDAKRLVMPPLMSVPLAVTFWFIFKSLFGEHYFLPAFAGLVAGYLIYDMGHYHWHHHIPRTRVGKTLRANHLRHHFQDHHHGYGVSSPLWDWVFGTAPRKR